MFQSYSIFIRLVWFAGCKAGNQIQEVIFQDMIDHDTADEIDEKTRLLARDIDPEFKAGKLEEQLGVKVFNKGWIDHVAANDTITDYGNQAIQYANEFQQ